MTEIPFSPILCFVTNRHRSKGKPLATIVRSAVEGGFNMIRIREPDLNVQEMVRLSTELSEIINGRALLVSNYRHEFQPEANLVQGIHFPEMVSHDVVQKISTEEPLIIGRSIHSLETGLTLDNESMDYLTFGTIFPSKTHPDGLTQGLETLSQLVNSCRIPILAIGGINHYNIADVMSTGVHGISVVGAISEAADPLASATQLASIAKLNFLPGNCETRNENIR